MLEVNNGTDVESLTIKTKKSHKDNRYPRDFLNY